MCYIDVMEKKITNQNGGKTFILWCHIWCATGSGLVNYNNSFWIMFMNTWVYLVVKKYQTFFFGRERSKKFLKCILIQIKRIFSSIRTIIDILIWTAITTKHRDKNFVLFYVHNLLWDQIIDSKNLLGFY